MGIPEKVVIFLFGVLMVFGAGWAYRGYADEHKQVRVLIAAQHETAQAIEQSTKDSVKVEADVKADQTRIDVIKKAVSIRLSTPTYREQNHDQPQFSTSADLAAQPCPVLAPVLDAGTVRLLNDARGGAQLRAAGGDHDQEPGAAGPAR